MSCIELYSCAGNTCHYTKRFFLGVHDSFSFRFTIKVVYYCLIRMSFNVTGKTWRLWSIPTLIIMFISNDFYHITYSVVLPLFDQVPWFYFVFSFTLGKSETFLQHLAYFQFQFSTISALSVWAWPVIPLAEVCAHCRRVLPKVPCLAHSTFSKMPRA